MDSADKLIVLMREAGDPAWAFVVHGVYVEGWVALLFGVAEALALLVAWRHRKSIIRRIEGSVEGAQVLYCVGGCLAVAFLAILSLVNVYSGFVAVLAPEYGALKMLLDRRL